MKIEDIAKLPPELRKAAELCEKGNDVTSNEFWERFDALPLALTWCLQVVEERDEIAEEKRIVRRMLALVEDRAIHCDSLGVAGSVFYICRFCGNSSEPGGEPTIEHDAKCIIQTEHLEAEVKDVWEEVPILTAENAELIMKLETSEATIATLTRELSVAMETIHQMGCNTDDCHECKAKLVAQPLKCATGCGENAVYTVTNGIPVCEMHSRIHAVKLAIAALSHTPEGGGK